MKLFTKLLLSIASFIIDKYIESDKDKKELRQEFEIFYNKLQLKSGKMANESDEFENL